MPKSAELHEWSTARAVRQLATTDLARLEVAGGALQLSAISNCGTCRVLWCV